MQSKQSQVCAQCGHSPLDHDLAGECQVVGRCSCAVRPKGPAQRDGADVVTERENLAGCAAVAFFVLVVAAALTLVWSASWRWGVTLAVVSVPVLLLWRRLVWLSSEARRLRMVPR